MKICGIIAEYNPFHKGHLHQLNEARSKTGADIIAIVMSGMFVQRGIPAISSKFARAKMAVLEGADIVIELPTCYALQSAEYFALGGVGILDGIGADYISYGTEAISSPQRATIDSYISIINENSDEYNKHVKTSIADGKSYASARIAAYSSITGDTNTDILRQPNAILESAYRHAIYALQSNIVAVPVDRKGDAYHATNPQSDLASATAIRKMINENLSYSNYIPKKAYATLNESDIAYNANNRIFDHYLHSLLLADIYNTANDIPDGSEEIANRLIDGLKYSDYEQYLDYVTTRRLSRARMNRAMLHMTLGIDSSLITEVRKALPLYARVLAMSENGQKHIGTITKQSRIDVVTSPARYEPATPLHKYVMDVDILASNIYNFSCSKANIYNQDYKNKLFIGKSQKNEQLVNTYTHT